MKKLAKDLKNSEKIKIADQICTIESIEISEIGKQGKRKVRLVVITPQDERMVLVRPEDYPVDVM